MAAAVATVGTGTVNGTSLVVTAPTGIAVGDYLALFVAAITNGAVTPPNGFVEITGSPVSASTNATAHWYTKIADSGDAAAGTFTVTVPSGQNRGAMHRITGASATQPYIAEGTSSTGTGTALGLTGYVGTYGDLYLAGIAHSVSTSFGETWASNFTGTEQSDVGGTGMTMATASGIWNGGTAADGSYAKPEPTFTAVNSTNRRAMIGFPIFGASGDPSAASTVSMVGTPTAQFNSGTFTLPTGTAAGDLLVCNAFQDFAGPTKPTGFTYANSGAGGQVSWKIADAADVLAGQVTGAGAGAAALAAFRGADPTTPIDVYGFNQTISSQTQSITSQTPTKANGYHYISFVWRNTNTSGGGGPDASQRPVVENASTGLRYSLNMLAQGTASSSWGWAGAHGVANASTGATGVIYGYILSAGTNVASAGGEFAFVSIMPVQHNNAAYFAAAM